MKTLASKSIFIIVFLSYLLSLFPLANMTENNGTDELRKTIQTLQILQANTSESAQNFNKSLKYSIQTIRNLAGLQTVIFEHPEPRENETSSSLSTSFRFPCLPAKSYNIAGFITIRPHSFKEFQEYYISPLFQPETPPPVTA